MKEIEDARTVLAVGLIEGLDTSAGVSEQRVIIRQRAFRRVTKIREQGKEQIGIAITQIANLQGFEKIINLLRPAQ